VGEGVVCDLVTVLTRPNEHRLGSVDAFPEDEERRARTVFVQNVEDRGRPL
jgi:hypothetical protein